MISDGGPQPPRQQADSSEGYGLAERLAGTVDLHTHSTASDGQLTPGELVREAVAVGLWALALTDHDTVAGVDEARCVARQLELAFIPGVELSVDWPTGECHLLGYFLDDGSPPLQQALLGLRDGRLNRGKGMVERLYDLGLPLSWERVQELAGNGTVTRAHVATALQEAGHVTSRQEAFDLYIGHGRPAYVPRDKMTPEEAIRLIEQAHGIAVLAHPTFAEPQRDWSKPLSRWPPWPFLERLRKAGLRGLEAYYGEYPPDLTARLCGLAAQYGLLVTGGSDFHGLADKPALGSAAVPLEAVSSLICLARQQGCPGAEEAFLALQAATARAPA